jgi:dTDP-4-dehydrorhamnose reductase
MRVLVTGGDGQLGMAIARRWRQHSVIGASHDELDITRDDAARRVVELGPELVINTAALTDVDGCERDPDAAFRVNALGARNVAVGAARAGAALVQISTDYVFPGDSDRPCWEFDRPGPVNVYGASKLAAEDLVRMVHDRVFVVRSAWLFGIEGQSFVTRILERADRSEPLEVVDDEVGSPTFCDDLADALERLVATRAFGVHHLVSEGACSRLEFARAILNQAGRFDTPVRPTSAFPRVAPRPKYTPLRNFAAAELGIRLPGWETGLARYFERRAVPA